MGRRSTYHDAAVGAHRSRYGSAGTTSLSPNATTQPPNRRSASFVRGVVVDAAAQGRQVGSALTTAALGRAGELGARTVDLTSRSSRVAANQLYRKLGFELRESNLLRFSMAD
ncbi:GNAT family N-acetyltransferase [Rhodococcus sp. IEGM 1379]|uniref:GNAT family N-acetyltransferase n=1 Tax=Rhodococcus sp. IEGM 1379 TaxID=3047086 RepID=UPI0024B6BA0C|nr:GNAT family N-acetyltransferase [Rhodococcus sp. IEGM 1379]MDI9914424.1 GNAT family N-acetyltransferase [Rhodococcus sp. IEGM 1379]